MPGDTMTTLDLATKNVYRDKMEQYMLKVRDSLLQKLGTKTLKLEGRKMILAAQTEDNQGMADGSESAALPNAGNMYFLNAEFFPREHSATMQVTQAAIERIKANGGSWIDVIADSRLSTMRAVRKEMEMQVHGDGTGQLAYLNASCDSTTITGLLGKQGPQGDHLLRRGALVDLVDGADYTTLHLTAATVTARTATGCTLDAAPSGSDSGDFFIRSGAKSQTMAGLDSVVSASNPNMPNAGTAGDTYYGNLNRSLAVNEQWCGQVVDGTSFSINGTLDAAVDLHQEWCDEKVGEIRMPNAVVRKIAGTVNPALVHWTQKELEHGIEVSYDELSYRGLKVVRDMMNFRETVFLLDYSTMYIGQTGKIKWLDLAGNVMQPVPNYKMIKAYTYWNRELVCTAPYRNIKIYNCLH
jgi:hypothetical protein